MASKTETQRAIAACRGTALAVVLFGFGINVLALVSPLYMMQVYDRVLSAHSTDTLIMLSLIAVLALAVLSVIDSIRNQVLARVGHWLDERLGPSVLASAMQASLVADTSRGSQALRDLSTVRGFLTGPGVGPLLDAPWAPLFIMALFLLHPLLGAVGTLGGVVLVILAILNEVLTRAPLAAANAAANKNQARSEAALRNAEVVRAMGMLEGIVRRWRSGAAETQQAHLCVGRRGAVILGLSKFARLAIQILVMAVGAWLVIHQEASPGTLFASSFLLGRALSPVENSIATWKSLVAARLAYRRLAELFRIAPPREPGMRLPEPVGELSVEGLSYQPPGADKPTLRGVACNVGPGEVLGVIGPSAAGKSTLARMIAGTATPSSGKVRLDGADIAVWLDAGGARHIGYLPQDVELFSGTVKDNIARLGEAEPEAVVAAAKLAGLHETIMRLPLGYDSDIGEAGVKLSGGQRQRVGLARALFGQPRLVILDEPNASLDHEGEAALVRAIAALKQRGATIIVIAHRPSILRLADKLLVLRDGMVEAFGSRDEVAAKLNPRPVTTLEKRSASFETAA
jgi:PrtD family type I secretion system ABC transporter